MQGELAAQAEWDYAPAPESRDIVSIAPEYGLFIERRVRARRRAGGSSRP